MLSATLDCDSRSMHNHAQARTIHKNYNLILCTSKTHAPIDSKRGTSSPMLIAWVWSTAKLSNLSCTQQQQVYEGYTRGIQGVIREAYEGYTRGIREIYKRYTRGIQQAYERYTRDIRGVYNRHTRGIQEIYEGYTTGIREVYKRYTRGFDYASSICKG